MKKFNFTTSATFTKIALKQTRVKSDGFYQILLFDRCNFCISPFFFFIIQFIPKYDSITFSRHGSNNLATNRQLDLI